MRGILTENMNILSFISIVIFTAFFMKCISYLSNYDKDSLNIPIAMVNATLGWWSLCSAFFFIAENKQTAWFWHKLGSIGWIGYIPATLYYFTVMTHHDKKMSNLAKSLIFLIIPSLFIARTFLFEGSSVAVDLVQSISGYGWTYVNKITSISFWAYFILTNGYFAYAFYIMKSWASTQEIKWRKNWMVMFISIDVIVLGIGYITDCIQPFIKPYVPPIANIGTLIFMIFYVLIMEKKYNVLSMDNAASPNVILQTVTEPIFLVNELGVIIKVNKAAIDMLLIPENELLQNKLKYFYEDPFAMDKIIKDVLCGKKVKNKEVKMFDKKNNEILTMVSANLALNKMGHSLGIIVAYRDITHLKHIENELRVSNRKNKELAMKYYNLANSDMLTKLPNRRCFFQHATDAELYYKKERRDFAIIYCDVDRFKRVNDTYGHQVGDKLLIMIANKLNACKGKNDLVARLGGDEFVILIENYVSLDKEVKHRIEALEYEFSKDIIIDNVVMDIGISFGAAMYSIENNINKMLENADRRMYACKKKNKENRMAVVSC